MNLHHPVLRPSLALTEPELDPAGLRRAADTFFPHGIGVADTALGRLKREFYAGADLAGRGELWGDADSVSLRRSLEDGIKAFLRRAGRPPKRLIVIGCGEGRLLGTIVAVAAAYGVAEIVLNDQFGFHLAHARDLAARMDLARRGLRLTFVEGDFAEVGGDLRGDLGLAWFFVLPEIVSAVSPAALRAKRDRFFAAVARCLGRHGVLIADRPDVSVGFYHRLQEASRTILAERGLMPGEEANVSLGFILGLGGEQPCHLRYLPGHAAALAEMARAGFARIDHWSQPAPHGPGQTLLRRKQVELWQRPPFSVTATQLALFDPPSGATARAETRPARTLLAA